jgi:hypothetical protein
MRTVRTRNSALLSSVAFVGSAIFAVSLPMPGDVAFALTCGVGFEDPNFATAGNCATTTTSTAVGVGNNTASNTHSSAFGWNNTASGTHSSALGATNTASGNQSSAVGNFNTATQLLSTAIGRRTRQVEPPAKPVRPHSVL